MYTSFFGLKCKPFELVPDPEFLLLSGSHKRALLHLNYGISENAGFILVTGEVGTGKTTLIRSMMQKLKSDVKLARINNTRVSSEQLISMINEDFGVEVKGRDKTGMLEDLTGFLIDQFSRGKKPVIIIDEAQNLSPDLLEEIRLLSNLETNKSKLLQIVLVGQPELMKVLAQPGLRQLRQRISISCHIQPLTRDEAEEYIFHRLEVAGNRQAVKFQEGAADLIHTFSRGVPRLINIACDFLMLSAFAEEMKEISADMVKEVIGELETSHGYWNDEQPETDGGCGSKPDLLKEILLRLEKLEAFRCLSDVTRAEREDLLIKISETEKLLNNALSQFRREIAGMSSIDVNARINQILGEIEAIKDRADDMERRQFRESEIKSKRKPNIWGRLFN